MNRELVQKNLEAIGKSAQDGNGADVCSGLLALAGVVLRGEKMTGTEKQNGEALRMLYGQYVKIGNTMLELLAELEQAYTPKEDEKKLNNSIAGIREKLEETQTAYGAVTTAQAGLLDSEAALRAEAEKLEKIKAKIEELTALKTEKIKTLRQETEQMKQSLVALDTTCKKSRETVERYQAELGEDGRLIRMLPEQYGTVKTVDELTATIREREKTERDLHDAFEQMLEKLIGEIENSYEKLKTGEAG